MKKSDRIITALQAIRWKLVELITEIDKWSDYIERKK